METKIFRLLANVFLMCFSLSESEALLTVGHGVDIKPFGPGNSITLGGVTIPAGFGVMSTNDGDVLTHAIADALLGAGGLGSLNSHFPEMAPYVAGSQTVALLREVILMLTNAGIEPVNVDASVSVQLSTLEPWIHDMRLMLANELHLPIEHVNIKATVPEGLSFTGRKEGILARATALVRRRLYGLAMGNLGMSPFGMGPFGTGSLGMGQLGMGQFGMGSYGMGSSGMGQFGMGPFGMGPFGMGARPFAGGLNNFPPYGRSIHGAGLGGLHGLGSYPGSHGLYGGFGGMGGLGGGMGGIYAAQSLGGLSSGLTGHAGGHGFGGFYSGMGEHGPVGGFGLGSLGKMNPMGIGNKALPRNIQRK